MSFFNSYLLWQTGIDQTDAVEAAELMEKCKAAAVDGKKVTDPNLCERIYRNGLLGEACKRRGISAAWPSPATVIGNFFHTCLHVIVAVLIFPISFFTSYYAHYRLNQMIENTRKLDDGNGDVDKDDCPKTAAEFIRSAEIRNEICRRSGSEPLTSYGPDNSLSSSYYNMFSHRVTVPKCLAKSKSPMALAVAAHECGHAEQRIFLIARLIAYITAIVAASICFVLFNFVAAYAILAIVAVAVVATSIVAALYEINASRRGLANLFAHGYVRGESAAKTATYALQLAALTYISGVMSSIFNVFQGT
ncbi:MAG: zinc metallopeptidase [Puniceicoccales bacterium]|jgi:hypothetical protein|nr:zinc metallopeptidase [Puniceicoccales bacterium]